MSSVKDASPDIGDIDDTSDAEEVPSSPEGVLRPTTGQNAVLNGLKAAVASQPAPHITSLPVLPAMMAYSRRLRYLPILGREIIPYSVLERVIRS